MSNPELTSAEAVFYQAGQAIAQTQWAWAEDLLRHALTLDPALAEAHANLAWLLERRGQPIEALAHYHQAVNLRPDNARVWANLGALLLKQMQHDLSMQAFQTSLQIEPGLTDAWNNLGALQAQLGQDVQAEASLRRAISLLPDHASAHFNLACLLLRKGRWDEGWQHLEARTWYAGFAAELDCPRWSGQDLQARAVLVGYEAGHGDVIQFCRYLALLHAKGVRRLGLICHPALKPLMQELEGVDLVMSFEEHWPRHGWDYWVPLMSLPGLFETRPDHVPQQLPYLKAPQARQRQWQSSLAARCPRDRFCVGLVWKGNPEFANDAQRSLPSLSVLEPLWAIPGVQFVSLQKGQGEAEALAAQHHGLLLQLGSELNDFADTAAVLEQLDLLISVDTAVAHLAGALKRPCWLLLPAYLTDWRWLEQRNDTPWYPGVMRLYRQTRSQDWSDVVRAMADDLGQRVAQHQAIMLSTAPGTD